MAADKNVGQVHIIGGIWRRSILPVAHHQGLRPTPNRVRETLFNWLGQDLQGWHCLDVFAGSGALGFEAASRGAEQVTLIEKDRNVAKQLQANATKLKAQNIKIICADGLQYSTRSHAQWDLIFLDPPFAAHLEVQALRLAHQRIKSNGWLYLESSQHFEQNTLEEHGWVLHRSLKAGAVYAHLLCLPPHTLDR